MSGWSARQTVFLCGLLLGRAIAGDTAPLSPAQRVAVQGQLRNRAAQERAKAVRRLVDFPPLDAARLLVQAGLADSALEVRQAAQAGLLTLAPRDDVARALLRSLDHPPRGPTPAIITALVSVLLTAAPAETQAEVTLRINGSGGKSKIPTSMLIDVADGLGQQATAAAVAALKTIARLPRCTESFALRRATVQALTHVRLPQAIDALVELLPQSYGEVRADVVRYLSTLVEETHGNDAQAWQAWWKVKKEGFRFPERPAAGDRGAAREPGAATAPQPAPAGPSYYGLQIHARRMVFVIDISGSMAGPRLQLAKRELIHVLSGLPDDAEFGLVAFSDQARAWQPQLAVATPAVKQRACQYVMYLAPHGMTASCDALETAMLVDAEVIYFLSDGHPTCGKIVEPDAIRAAVSRQNYYRRISIYTIGIAPGLPDNPLDTFLKKLAEENFGLYRRVEQ